MGLVKFTLKAPGGKSVTVRLDNVPEGMTDDQIAAAVRARVPDIEQASGVPLVDVTSPLAGDYASRMARARELGFDVDRRMAHASQQKLDEFKIPYGGAYLSDDAGQVESIFSRGATAEYNNATEAGEYFIRPGRQFDARWENMGDAEKETLRKVINDVVDEGDIRDAAARLDISVEDADPFELFTDGEFYLGYGRDKQNDVLEGLRRQGYESVVFPDALTMGTPHESTVVFDPSQIRSVNAAFDPAKKDSANLLASAAPVAVGLGAALAPSEEAEAGPLKSGANTIMSRLQQSAQEYTPIAGERISTRYPTAVDAPENVFDQELIIDTNAMRGSPKAFEQNMRTMSQYPQLRTPLRNPGRRAEYFSGLMQENLLDLYGRIPEDVADISRQWYVGANRFASNLAQRAGRSLESVSGVLAALSPQKDWYQNASLAERLVDIYNQPGVLTERSANKARQIFSKDAYRDDLNALLTRPWEELSRRQKAMYIRATDEAENARGHRIMAPTGDLMDWRRTKSGEPRGTAWGSLGEIEKAVSVLDDPSMRNISQAMGQQHKVRNFYNNIVNPMAGTDITVDTHAVAADLFAPYSGNSVPVTHNFGGTGSSSSAITGAKGTYGLHADAYRGAASQADRLPRELQSITWEGVRELFPDTLKRNEKFLTDIDTIWEEFRTGRRSLQSARDAIVERAGGIGTPDWARARPDAIVDAGEGPATYTRRVDGPGISGTAADGVDSGTGSDGARSTLRSLTPAAALGAAIFGVMSPEDAEAASGTMTVSRGNAASDIPVLARNDETAKPRVLTGLAGASAPAVLGAPATFERAKQGLAGAADIGEGIVRGLGGMALGGLTGLGSGIFLREDPAKMRQRMEAVQEAAWRGYEPSDYMAPILSGLRESAETVLPGWLIDAYLRGTEPAADFIVDELAERGAPPELAGGTGAAIRAAEYLLP